MLVFNGWERNVYYLTSDNRIFNRASNGAANTFYHVYTFRNGQLVLESSVIYDGFTDPDNPWFYQEGSGEPVSITEEDARRKLDSVVTRSDIPFIPFADPNETIQENVPKEEASSVAPPKKEPYGYAEHIAWLIPWREEQFEDPQPLYYYLYDWNRDGIEDMILGYEEEVLSVWTYMYDGNSNTIHMTLMSLSEEEYAEITSAWLDWDIRNITEFPMDE